jgi:hypothetical protein
MLAMFAHGVPSVLYVLLYGGTLHFQLGQNTLGNDQFMDK